MANQIEIKGTKVHVGDIVRVHLRVLEGEKERVQIFEGMVIGIRGRDENKTFTVRKIATGNIGVERIIPVFSPWIVKISIKKTSRVRRAKLGYIRRKSSKQVAQISQTPS
jgi:large subunit ribosomal protein L19